ncbi:long-chain acyl-CoA synthetase [Actinokineospora alba]|uniref:Acyl-CoA synthetase n=1 Tax=Actinokineospora alba TaxID=504798 RepID=A0A1H0EY87_9PSEU|nr:AMP-binding protein [Actinokineospora alba]TDP69271.1 long-chain acyl-CoA synthetase [Actinokineospora alba]SDI20560.1 long-chain acyl-CoA synthetase [Actinokineospora alba]SDN87358.1 long-chain acyl-CoA synthetase [Actinokineospora alba]
MTQVAEPGTKTTTTIVTRVRDRARAMPDAVAMREKDFGIWQEVSWSDYWDKIELVGHALLALGVAPGDRVAIQSENRREWLYTDLAAVAVRAMTVGLYPTNPASEVAYLLAHSGSKILLAEDQEQADKVLSVLDELPELERIVYLEPRGIRRRYDNPKLLFWEDLLAMGAEHRAAHPGAVEETMSQARSEDIMTLVYTSGTTGPPKGAMLTVANVEFSIQTLIESGGFTSPPPSTDDIMLSYLPLCHVAERIFTTWFNSSAGVQVNFAESIATVQPNLREIQPTILFGVPRIWEKVLAGVNIKIASASPAKRALARFWLKVADGIGDTLVRTGGKHTPGTRLRYALGYLFLYRALRDRIGMRKVRYAASGAAPIAPDVLKFFMGIGVPMHEVYGMTENSAIATANRPGRVKLGTVGEPHPGVDLRVDEETGEILTRHAGVFAGYWRDEEATAKAVDEQGWLHTGDVGVWVDGTHVKITDRMKDIIITAGGKNVAPSEIENALKVSPYIKEAVVIGDKRPYLTALIGVELETVGEWAQRKRIPYTTYRDLSERPEVIKLVQGIVDDVNTKFANVEQIKKFRMLPKELDHEDGELTATQKVKRSALGKLFDDLVESMYAKGGGA